MTMLFLRYLLLIIGFGLFAGAAVIIVYDLYLIFKGRKDAPPDHRGLSVNDSPELPAQSPGEHGGLLTSSLLEAPTYPVRWHTVRKLAMAGAAPVLVGLSIAVIPSGNAGVRVSQLFGPISKTLYPGVHMIVPLVDHVELYNIRDNVFSTTTGDKDTDTLKVQTKEGLGLTLAVTVRYRLDASKLPYIYANLPQPVESEIVPPVVSSTFRELAPNYQVREVFAAKREEVRRQAAAVITQKLAGDGVVVKEVLLRDVQLPVEYAKSLEGLLLKEQENERLSVELEVKAKEVRQAELEAEAEEARQVKAAEGQAQVTVLQAKAQADAMQYTLPLKEKQIQQSKLEAQARKEATVENAEAMAEAKVIDGKAEVEKSKLMADSDDYRIRRVASANAERMKLEAEVLKENPLLIQKIIAEKLSDKVQIMMVPNDGKFFFANDVLKGMTGQ
jgi:regulator of protease activity HflC (stomatin/prohibitin superfamily)